MSPACVKPGVSWPLGVPRKIRWNARTKAAAVIKAPTEARKVIQGEERKAANKTRISPAKLLRPGKLAEAKMAVKRTAAKRRCPLRRPPPPDKAGLSPVVAMRASKA